MRDSNIDGAFQCFEAARRHRIPRVVFASTNHAAGFTPRRTELPADAPARPDTLYAASKVFGEALGRYYVDRYGLQVACLRIGSCQSVPPDHRALATWLSPDDCGRLVDAALRYDDLDYAVVWGVSANSERWWSLEAGRAIGYEPHDDAARFAGQLAEAGKSAQATERLLGGDVTSPEFGIDEVAARA